MKKTFCIITLAIVVLFGVNAQAEKPGEMCWLVINALYGPNTTTKFVLTNHWNRDVIVDYLDPATGLVETTPIPPGSTTAWLYNMIPSTTNANSDTAIPFYISLMSIMQENIKYDAFAVTKPKDANNYRNGSHAVLIQDMFCPNDETWTIWEQ